MRVIKALLLLSALAAAGCAAAGAPSLPGSIPPGTGDSAAAKQAGVHAKRPAVAAESVLFSFQIGTGCAPLFPSGALFVAGNGALVGTTTVTGGSGACAYDGAAFKIKTDRTMQVLHRFTGALDGAYPETGVIGDGTGAFYGTTTQGGNGAACAYGGCGTVFKLTPDGTGGYDETILHRFQGGSDGDGPTGQLLIGSDGALYGTTDSGGAAGCSGIGGCGTVFRLSTSGANYSVLYAFRGGRDGAQPLGGVTQDASGNLIGTTIVGGAVCDGTLHCGTVFKLTPTAYGYAENIVYRFGEGVTADGEWPASGLTFTNGSYYGSTSAGGNASCNSGQGEPGGCGTIYQLTPPTGGAGWRESVVHQFGPAPHGITRMPSGLAPNSAGVLYGTTQFGSTAATGFPYGYGTVFSFNPASNSFAIVYQFNGPPSDGADPSGTLMGNGNTAVELSTPGSTSTGGSYLAIDATGALYGGTASGGTGACENYSGCGTVYALSGAGAPIRRMPIHR